MAKRSVRRARARESQQRTRPEGHESAATQSSRGRGFWLGALTSAATLIPLTIIAVLLLSGGDRESAAADPPAGSAARVQTEVEELRRESAVRDKQQIEDLTQRARSMVEDFAPAIVGMGKTLPPGEEPAGPLADAAEVDEWRRLVREADAYFDETVSGETATNVARSGLANAVDVLREALETYKLALAEPSARDALLRRAAEQRDLAARTWSTAATQLDAINIAAGFGHQHVTFPSSAGPDAVPPDALPEGTDATEP